MRRRARIKKAAGKENLPPFWHQSILQGSSVKFLFAVFAAVYFLFLIRKHENVWKPLLDGSDAAGILAVDDVFDFLWKRHYLFGDDFAVFDDVHGDIVVDDCQNVKVKGIDVAFHLQDILLAHLVASGIFDDGDRAVQLVQLQMMVDGHAFSCLDMVENEALFNFSYV